MCLLTGARGTGKSSLIKACLNTYAPQGLRLIEVDKEDLTDLPDIIEVVAGRDEKFVVYCDDLSFEDGEPGYKALKSILDGTVAASTPNVLVYATSNRRHLLPEYMSENLTYKHTDDGEVHPGEGVEEKISLSERFGLWISFYPFSQDEYLTIAGQWLSALGATPAQIAAAPPRCIAVGFGARLTQRPCGLPVCAGHDGPPSRSRMSAGLLVADGERAREDLSAGQAERAVVDVAVGVLLHGEEFLLTSRPEGKVYAGYWEFPGGKLEAGESVEQALRRELQEELGITIGAAQLWKTQMVDYPHALVRLHFCKVWGLAGRVANARSAIARLAVAAGICDAGATGHHPRAGLAGRRASVHWRHARLKPQGFRTSHCKRGSPKGSSGGVLSGSLNSSLAHAPKSTPLQRALQNGR